MGPYTNYYNDFSDSDMRQPRPPRPNYGRPRPMNNRLIGGGFVGPFLLGGLTGGLVAPFFYGNRPNYYYPNYYYPPYYRPF